MLLAYNDALTSVLFLSCPVGVFGGRGRGIPGSGRGQQEKKPGRQSAKQWEAVCTLAGDSAAMPLGFYHLRIAVCSKALPFYSSVSWSVPESYSLEAPRNLSGKVELLAPRRQPAIGNTLNNKKKSFMVKDLISAFSWEWKHYLIFQGHRV